MMRKLGKLFQWHESDGGPNSVRSVLLRGIFFRILIIEGILLVWSLLYRIISDPNTTPTDLFWYALRIIILILIIILETSALAFIAGGVISQSGMIPETQCKPTKSDFSECIDVCSKHFGEGCWESCVGVFDTTGKLL